MERLKRLFDKQVQPPSRPFTIVAQRPPLCPEAEPRLKKAIDKGTIVVINGLLLVKLEGILAGVGLADTEEIKQGTWYRPASPLIREQIRRSFVRGKAHIVFPRTTELFALGSLADSIDPHSLQEVSQKLTDESLMKGIIRRLGYVQQQRGNTY